MKRINLEVSDELLERIDEARKTPAGEIKRNAWIRSAVEQRLQILEFAARNRVPSDLPHVTPSNARK